MNCLRWITNKFVLLATLGVTIALTAHAEDVVWDKTPIHVELIVGVESRLDFSGEIRVGLSPKLSDKELLREESLSGSAYFTANKPFGTERVYVSLVKSNTVVLLDVSARAKRKNEVIEPRSPLKIVISEAANEQANSSPSPNTETKPLESDQKEPIESDAITPITLCRYAAQQLYAPARLIPQKANIQRVPMRAPKVLAQLYAGGDVRPEPIASWSGGGLFVTAVKLSNLTKLPVDLDPRKLRGRILHAAFQDKSLRLGPLGSPTDTTTIYLITDHPFADSVTLKG